MSSYTFTLTGNSSELTSTFFPEITLDDKAEYSCALLELTTYHSIPNVTESNNKIYYCQENGLIASTFIPVGCYEADELLEYIKVHLKSSNFSFNYVINKNTFKTTVECSTNLITGDLYEDNILTSIFGFTNGSLIPENKCIESQEIIKISNQDVVRVECNLTSGSYINGKRSQSIYEFATNRVGVGHKIIERPHNLIYMPVTPKRINFIQISFIDEKGEPIDFRGETITCRIHIKKNITS